MRTVVFDFGNVVAFFDHRKASRQLAALTGTRLTEDEVFGLLFGGSLEADFDCGKLSSHEFVKQLRELLGATSSDEEIVEAWCNIFWPNQELAKLLPRLKRSQTSLILASNTNVLHFQWITVQFGVLLAYFDDFVLSFRIGHRKPALAFFQRCVEVAATSPGSCVYVDDRSEFVAVARTVGMTSFVYGGGNDLAQNLITAGIELA